jgi:hypothetical protein
MLIYQQYRADAQYNRRGSHPGKVDGEFTLGRGKKPRSFQEEIGGRPDLVHEIKASGTELLYIVQHFQNIPTVTRTDGTMTWADPWARFIAENLP